MKRSPLKRKTPLKAKTPMKRVSKKQKDKNDLYSKQRVEFLSENPYCAVCGSPATQVHHKMARGIYTNDKEYFLAVCALDHQKIEDNKKWAREMGYILYK